MSQMIIEKINNGWKIKDTITDFRVSYIGYTLPQAIKKHRQNFNLQNNKFEKIYLTK